MIKKKWFDKHVPKKESDVYEDWSAKEIRLRLGMTQKELAAVINCPLSTYVGWEIKNTVPAEIMQKILKMYDDAKDRIVDDGIDIINKISYIRHRYGVSYDRLAQLIGVRHGSTVKMWMDGVKPKLKYIAEINQLYYGLVNQNQPKVSRRRQTFCRLNPLDRTSWKAEIEFPVIAWR
ncbi:TPA: helix-turn-helix domain-containing protein [Streptococcus suis]